MITGLEGIAAKARMEPNLVFTSVAHHITKDRIWDGLNHMPTNTAKGIDGIDVNAAKENLMYG